MHMFDLIKRLSIRKKIEASLRTEEEMLLKMAGKYYRTLNKTDAAVKDELTKKQNNQLRLRALEKTNKKLKLILQQADTKSREYENLQIQYENLTRQQEEELMRNCIKKECTNVFINTKALPRAVQGMSVCQNQWVPFSFPINSLDMSEVPLVFWSHTQRYSPYRDQWDKLIFDSISLN